MPNNETYPLWSQIHMEYQATEYTTRGPLKLTWYDGGRKPDDLLAEWEAGLGTKGAFLVNPAATAS